MASKRKHGDVKQETSVGKDWHSLKAEDVVKSLDSNAKRGLTEDNAKERTRRHGHNKLPEEKPLSGFRIFLSQFKSPMIYILVIAGIATLYLQDYTDSIVIFAAVGLNTVIGYFQENKASRALSELKKVLKDKAIVVRDGHEKEIMQEYVVPGDIVMLKTGSKVPADCRIIREDDLKVNEAALTGEWIASNKTSLVLKGTVPLADRENMVYMGTVVESGEGTAVVTATGLGTEIGKVALLVRETKEESTPYQKKLAQFSKILGIIIAVICVLIFVEGMWVGGDFEEMFTTSVAVAVAAIPEGLPVAMTVILSVGMQRILARKGLVRRLSSAETLGSTSIICTDKTGTLTEAKMEAAIVLTSTKQVLSVDGKYSEPIDIKGRSSHALALKIATSCVDAFIENPEDPKPKWIVRGRPTDRALLVAGAQAGITKEFVERTSPKVADIPFDSVSKYSATLNKISRNSYDTYVLGAPEIILGMSGQYHADGAHKKLSSQKMKEFTKRYETLTGSGMRVLATAYRSIGKVKKSVRNGEDEYDFGEKDLKELVFVGFIGLEDPVRPSAKRAIKKCEKAGMKAIMITGDNRLTAMAVAEKLGMKVDNGSILEGHDLDRMNDEEFKKRVGQIVIYARTEPAQKLRIVKALQERGEVVAMTGDGINDAPALKQADIGVAVGSGTDVAKEVSDLVLLKDDFSVIVAAVEEGRAIIDNIRKVVVYLLSDAFTEIVLIGGSLLAGFPLPLTAAQILWVNLIEDGLPGIALTFEPKEEDVMKKKPEPLHSQLLTREMKAIIFIIGLTTDIILLGLFFWLTGLDHGIDYVRTMVFACLTIDSLFYVFSCKSLRKNLWHIDVLSNKVLVASWAIGVVMLVAAIYVPVFQVLLRTVPIAMADWAIVCGLGVLNVALIESAKWYFISRHEAV